MTGRSLDARGRPPLRLDPSGERSGEAIGPSVPGRRVVLGAMIALLIAWGSIYLLFSAWRSGVEERIAFGKANVVPVVGGLAEVRPDGVSPDEWLRAVDDTEAMIDEVVGTGRIDQRGLEALRIDLSSRVNLARNHPEDSVSILAGIWDEMARVKRFRAATDRPEILSP